MDTNDLPYVKMGTPGDNITGTILALVYANPANRDFNNCIILATQDGSKKVRVTQDVLHDLEDFFGGPDAPKGRTIRLTMDKWVIGERDGNKRRSFSFERIYTPAVNPQKVVNGNDAGKATSAPCQTSK